MNGTNSTSQNPDIRFDSMGKYTVTLLASNRIGAGTVTKNDYITVSKSAGIESMEELASSIELYPNPANGILHISTEKLSTDKISEINLINMLGQKIASIPMQHISSSMDIDISSIPNGNYILQLSGKNGIYTKRLVKE